MLERHPGQPLLDELRVLNRWLRARRDDGGGVLLVSSHGGPMHRSAFARLWWRLAEAAGLPPAKWHPHVAKHTTGTLLARSGASAFLIRQHLGHRSISSSQVYCTVSDRDASAAAREAFIRAF